MEDRIVEINEAERKKEKRMKRNEDNLRHLWDTVKCPNIQITHKQRLRVFSTTSPALQRILNELVSTGNTEKAHETNPKQ